MKTRLRTPKKQDRYFALLQARERPVDPRTLTPKEQYAAIRRIAHNTLLAMLLGKMEES
jgi:hypothetical protein